MARLAAEETESDEPLADVHPLTGHQTLEEQSYMEMRRLITEGSLHPGDRISVNAMAKRLAVSRLPVIHALRRLASEGFVQIRPHKNVVVAKPTLKDMRGQFLMFAALEEVALREAWPLAPDAIARLDGAYQRHARELEAGAFGEDTDGAFHEMIWRAAGIEYLYTTIHTLWNLTAYYRMLVYKGNASGRQESITEHQAILQALQSGDLEGAIAHSRGHRLNSLRRVEHVMTEVMAATDVSPAV